MIITAKHLVEFVKKALAEQWGYVWGGQGQLYTRELAEKWGKANRSGKSYDYYVNKCGKWIGHIVVDCSGLIVEAFRSVDPNYGDRSSTGFFNQCVEKGPIKTIPEILGLCVWRQGHIGIYIGGGKVIEAGGYKVGVVETPLNKPATGKQWTHWGKLKDVDYEQEYELSEYITHIIQRGETLIGIASKYGVMPAEIAKLNNIEDPNFIIAGKKLLIPVPPEPENAFRLGRLLKVKSTYMRGDDVLDVQIALKQAGFDPGKLDGIYGPKTQAAVMAFQKAKGLKVDGIVGPQTTNALGGIWVK